MQVLQVSWRLITPLHALQTDHPRSLAFSLNNEHHKADNHDDKQDRHPYPAVSIHPTAAPITAIHHVSALRQRDTAGQQRHRTNSHSKQGLHKFTPVKDIEMRIYAGILPPSVR
jgi:hypothetical protein